ncbi:hypothetical protein [Cognatishimia sp. MH4019]|uniref:hypothetical protein n=1 Tax=Cognatishimia sp. MH4019 TaxID=2854030 RepID=UPI001CD4B99A|nr:hypothetical protein [Cognatishimia sp. MH4019]
MGFLNRLFTRIKGAPPTDYLLVRNLPDPLGKIAGQPMPPDEVYVEVFVESLRLKAARKFTTRFHGMIYSFITLARDGEPNAELAAITKPGNLADLDPKNLDRVITVERQLLGAVPWRGGTLSLELGLFSVKSGNLLSPVLDYVTHVSDQAGISFVGSVKPFLPLITEGLDLIAGQSADVEIEVALDTDMTLSRSELMALVAVPKDKITVADLSVDPTDRKLLWKGKPLQEAYCVLSLRRTDHKADFGEIPELSEGYKHFRDALKTRRRTLSEEAKGALVSAIYLSPDLIERDKTRLVKLVEDEFKRIVTGGGISTGATATEPLGALADLPLYPDQ